VWCVRTHACLHARDFSGLREHNFLFCLDSNKNTVES